MYDALYMKHGSRMKGIAYRMLGSVSDAEDAVHDVFAKLAAGEPVEMQYPGAYLAKLTVNRCLNILKSARRRRESYIGAWLPEPIIESAEQGPEARLDSDGDVSYAWLVMLERLTPAERAVFVLRESFGYGYDELASMLGKTEANCRKLQSRAAAKLKDAPQQTAQPEPEHVFVWMKAFLKAARDGDFTEVIARLSEDAVLVSDGGGKVRAAINPIYGRERVAAFFEGLSAKGAYRGEWAEVFVNGQRGLMYRKDDFIRVITVVGDEDGRISSVYMIMNPDKLVHVNLLRGVTNGEPTLS
ncbi:RNA polymerase sigma factor SigJ [Cohnella sp. GCM10027633]|uniref:RNA polymerase sigma factor SigJ n=1 Tax=unclassified Cohnella TaxID=2636738 RepID=UPI003631783C